MGKRVFVINGSPRAGGNTEQLCGALMEGVKSAGGEAEMASLRLLDIKPCIGCYKCREGAGDPCIQRDDMKAIYAGIGASDVIVFASPLYWWQITAQMKAVIDRIFALPASQGMKMPRKEAAMLIAAGDENAENFAQVVTFFKIALTANIGWENRGMVLAGGVNRPGDIAGTHWLDEARALGASL